MDTNEIKSKTIRSIVALTGRQAVSQVITLLTLIPLGLFLSPVALGTFIVVSSVTPFFNFFVDLGLGSALIQKNEEPTDNDLKTVFTVQTILVLLISIIGFLLTDVLIKFSKLTSDGVHLYWVLLFVLFVSSLKSIPSILMERKIAFDKQVIPSVVEQLVYSLIVVILAYKGFQVASYSWAFGISAIVGLPIYYLLSPWKIGIGISVDSLKRLMSYGVLYQSKTILSLVKDNLLTLFLSGLPGVGSYGLGMVGWWQKWAYSPYNLVVNSVTKVTFPTYSRVQDNKEKLRAGVERSLFAVSLVMFPVAVAMIFSMEKILILLPKYQIWSAGLPAFYFYCLGAAVSSISGILVNTLDATGHVKTTSFLMVFWIILLWPITVVLVKLYGFTGVAAAPFFVSLTVFITAFLVKRVVMFNFLASISKPFLSAVAMSVAMYFVSNLFLSLLSGMIIYLLIVWLLAKDKLMDNYRVVLAAFKK